MKIALCHEWTLSRFGSEKVASRMAQTLDIHDVYSFAVDEDLATALFPGSEVRSSRLGRTAFAKRHWPWLLPLMGRWWRNVDLSGYDVVVTCSHAAVNSIRVRPGAAHVSYCCTPMRYAWHWRSELGRIPVLLRPLWPAVAALLRRIDRRRAGNVHEFIALSADVARRIQDCYGRSSRVIHPPVDTAFYHPAAEVEREDSFLYAGRLVAYKRTDIAIEAANLGGFRLVIAGGGPELERLKRRAGPTVQFRENPSDEELRDLYRRARALVFPGVEDFGIVMVEAQACGTPVIAFGVGGACETVRDGVTGVLYSEGSARALAAAVRGFDAGRFDPSEIRRHAETFDERRFDERVRELVCDAIGSSGASR